MRDHPPSMDRRNVERRSSQQAKQASLGDLSGKLGRSRFITRKFSEPYGRPAIGVSKLKGPSVDPASRSISTWTTTPT